MQLLNCKRNYHYAKTQEQKLLVIRNFLETDYFLQTPPDTTIESILL